MNIDLKLLKNIFLDFENDMVTIGPGVVNSQVYDLLYDVKKELRNRPRPQNQESYTSS